MIKLERPVERVSTCIRLDPDLPIAIKRIAKSRRMRRIHVFNQILRAGIKAIGEEVGPPPTAA